VQSGTLLPAARVGIVVLDRTIELPRGTTVVGRDRRSDVPLADAQISLRHASLANDDGKVSVLNISSTNQLFVNEAPLEPGESRALQIGDRLKVGSHELRVCLLSDVRRHPGATR
jgi:predicted component of type VI protein secretion system